MELAAYFPRVFYCLFHEDEKRKLQWESGCKWRGGGEGRQQTQVRAQSEGTTSFGLLSPRRNLTPHASYLQPATINNSCTPLSLPGAALRSDSLSPFHQPPLHPRTRPPEALVMRWTLGTPSPALQATLRESTSLNSTGICSHVRSTSMTV